MLPSRNVRAISVRLISRSQEYQWRMMRLTDFSKCSQSQSFAPICIILTHVLMGNSSVTHVTFFQFFYFHWATIKHLVDQSNKFKVYDDLGVQLYVTT